MEGQGSAKKAVYADIESGEKVFVKISGDKKRPYKEYNNQLCFYDLAVNDQEFNILIPKPLGIKEINGEYALIMEYIPNATFINDVEKNEKANIYLRVLMFLYQCNKTDCLHIVTGTYQVLSLPYFLIMNVIFYPGQFNLITKCFIKVLKNSYKWLILHTKYVCQGDINKNNMMISGDKLVLLDFLGTCISHKYYNMAQSLNSNWNDADFQKVLYGRVVNEFNLPAGEQKILKSFVCFNLMQRLCKKYSDKNQSDYYFSKMEKLIEEL